MSEFFIHRPIFASVISIVIVIAGSVAFFALPIEKFPPITPPTVEVTASYPGANSKTIAEVVAAPIEQAVNGVEGMLYMSSTSTNDGKYTLTVTFDINMNIDIAAVLVQNLVASVESKLPAEVRQLGVTTKKKSTQTLHFISISSPDDRYDELFLSNYMLDVRDELKRVAGIGDVMTFGAGDYSMRVWLDTQKLRQRGLTTSDIVNAVNEQNVQVAAGQVGAPPVPEGVPFQLTINTQGRLVDVEQFENIILRTGADGSILRIKDIGRVELGGQTYTVSSRFMGKKAAVLATYQLPGANAVSTSEAVREKMEEIASAPSWPQGLEYVIAYDATDFVLSSIDEVYSTLFMAVALVIIVIFVFLQDWRATIVPVAAIPVSLIGTFALMSGLGFSLNMLSLFGIVLAIGIVVDDAIVVVENSTRHVQNGMKPREAAVKAMSEITGPVIATTLVLLAVFVPCAFMEGITGSLFRQFALTISSAVIISTINALTLSPALCGIFLRPPKEKQFIGFRMFNQGFDWFTAGYSMIVKQILRRMIIVILGFFALVGVTGWGLSQLPTGFVPDEDQGVVFVNVQLPDASSKERTDEVMKDLNAVYEGIEGVKGWLNVTGYSLLGGSGGSNVGFSVVILEPWEKRKSKEQSVANIQRLMKAKFDNEKRAVVFSFTPPPIDGLGLAGGFQMEMQDRGSNGFEVIQATSDSLVDAARKQSNLASVNTTFRATVPQLFVDVNRSKAKTLKVPLSEVYGTLQTALGSTYVNDFTLNNRSYQVRIQAEAEQRMSADDISKLDVRDINQNMIPLGTIAEIRDDFGPDVVKRYNLYPSVSITGNVRPGVSSGDGLNLMEQVADSNLPPSFAFEWTGMSYQEKQASGGQYLIFLLAIVFVFLVLAAQYESWTSPAAVIAVVPLAALGVVAGILIQGGDNNTYTQISIVLLVALASKNAILIVEFASELRRDGEGIQEAAAKAAELRFRAILMTAFSSILGFIPLLFASGAGAASRQAVGVGVVGGMAAATLFALLLVPTFFLIFRSISEWMEPVEEDGEPDPKSA